MRLIDADALKRKYEEQAAIAHNKHAAPASWSDAFETVAEDIEMAVLDYSWISVKDRLPKRYERILTYDKYSGVRENWLLQSDPCVSWSYGFHVTHWMPMPEPPKETT